MERSFFLDKYNTWYDWRFYLTSKSISDADPKTKYVELDGADGTLDLSESLTGEVKYKDRTISASFWTDNGNRKDREALIRQIRASLHGQKIKIIEPDDPTHYFYGRVKIKSTKNIVPYAEFNIEATCDPWRYAITETIRRVDVASPTEINVVLNNNGVKTLSPIITVTGTVTITYNGSEISLTDGEYKIPDIKLYQGVNIISVSGTVSGTGSVTFIYREAEL